MGKVKYIIGIILFFIVCGNIESQDIYKLSQMADESKLNYNYYDKIEKDMNLSLKVIFPPPNDFSTAFFCFSTGIGYGIIQEYYYVGIAGDVALGTDLISLLFSDDIDSDREYTQFGISLGIRVYNLINFFNFTVIPFFGCDFMFIVLPMPYTGIEIMYKIFGIEYAYYLPINDIPRHQISIKFHLSKN